ncbi:MAG: histidinol dehydrogenase [Planctomycetes bacterium]|nr:histidinol dehydrogenase [Planctomycetota bacterium]
MTMRIIATSDTDFEAQLERITGRMSAQERSQPASARKKTIEVFGEPLSPVESVRRIVEDVREKGDQAVADYALKLDGYDVRARGLRVPADEISSAPGRIDPALYAALEKAADNVRRYQQHVLIRQPEALEDGGRKMRARYRPMDVAGVHIPGALAPYPSTLIMGAVPALAAGVKRVYVCSLPEKGGRMNPVVLAAASACGITELYRIGGVVAIAAMAFGTDTIPKADKVVGPGNYFVMLAKKEIYGHADIDMFAGPSEILVLADDSADPAYVAADLLSQAEHGSMASAVLVTTSRELVSRVEEKLEEHLAALPDRATAEEGMRLYGAAIVAAGVDECIELANRIAPEHLEILLEQPERYVDLIENAGAIFVGPNTPEPVGDYIAGSSHILPTGATARFFSGLSANSFLKRTSIVSYTQSALAEDAGAIAAIARAEGFHAHALSADIRTKK